jgi:hypothetical protein
MIRLLWPEQFGIHFLSDTKTVFQSSFMRDRPAFRLRLIKTFVEGANRRLVLVSPFARGVGVVNVECQVLPQPALSMTARKEPEYLLVPE